MTTRFQRITPFFWFKNQAEEAARFYTSIFENSEIGISTRYSAEVAKVAGQPEGSIMTIAFQLDGQNFVAMNGAPFEFSLALSLVVNCRSQQEVDHFWDKLSAGGDEKAQMCGWLKDRFGVSWQIVPTELPALLSNPDPAKARRATEAMMQMKKLDLDVLRKAAG
jgi:predicted 3-demethylubiquinone-9 3-methyltransferase (glyoxalase superfamily)